ncbi:hypothetical protein A1Q2_06143 [Trichosporon asahii var. asahii CBS 8904]|uniref:ENTH domain-containing protein n=1 Tax=Trichosporon asahii var. asahii (strain CBS 8904) TaxID=1220162 RepID=K1VSJ0_TRIAC|nr:hypothetical protein A1Q2_06143 [Trichosporon asahii var. asahii CBS 8904]
MNELAQLTYKQGDFVEIMEMLDKRLNDKGKNWRHVFKALTVLDYILHAGSENVVIYFKDNLYIVKTLKEFVYVDDQGKDVGHNVRQKAKDITNLLQDEDRLRAERRQRGAMRDRMLGNIADHGLQGEDDYGGRNYDSSWRDQERQERRPTRRNDDEDSDLQRALAESMQSSQDEDRRRSQQRKEEDELQRAIRLSEEEEAKRKREQEEANQRALMDDSFQLESNNMYTQQPQQTGFPLVDMSGGWNQQQLQPQYTSFNVSLSFLYLETNVQPFAAQMQQQQQQQQMYQQQLLQQQQQEEYMRQQQEAQARAQMQSSLLPQHTAYGSNNPFAPKPTMPQQTGSLFDSNPQPQIQQQPTGMFGNSFNPQDNNNNAFTPQSNQTLTPTPAAPKPFAAPKKDDGEHAGLANLIGRGREDGLDTFGNVGNLREYCTALSGVTADIALARSAECQKAKTADDAGASTQTRKAMQSAAALPAITRKIFADVQGTGLGANNPFGQQNNNNQQNQQQQQTNNEQPFFTI